MAVLHPACWFLAAFALSQAERVYIEKLVDRASPIGLSFRVVGENGTLGNNGTMRGAGGRQRMNVAKARGADAIRTWHIWHLESAAPEAEERGMKISVGIWITHNPSHYQDCTTMWDPYWDEVLGGVLPQVRKYKTSPAILWWTVGNEVEIEVGSQTGSDCLWKRLNWLVRHVKEEDPYHPVGTVLAGASRQKVENIVRLCPDLDFLGINSYGDDALRVGADLREAGWRKAYSLMEFGPVGHWSAPLTSWGSYIEESSSQKVVRYRDTCNSCKEDPQCVGAFAFVWGWKWEKTGTWYGMFNDWKAVTEPKSVSVPCPGCQSETVATMEECWTNAPAKSPAPHLWGMEVNGRRLQRLAFTAQANNLVSLDVLAHHPWGHKLTAVWAVTEEIVSSSIGGAWEATNPLLYNVFHDTNKQTHTGLGVTLDTTRLQVGVSYRLYVFVREDPWNLLGREFQPVEATATLPFHICQTARKGSECYGHVTHAMEAGIHADPGLYPGVTPASSFEEFQVLLHQMGRHNCDMPCGEGHEDWCHTAEQGDRCYNHINSAVRKWTANATAPATREMVQDWLHQTGQGHCPQSCRGKTWINEGRAFNVSEEELEGRRDLNGDTQGEDEDGLHEHLPAKRDGGKEAAPPAERAALSSARASHAARSLCLAALAALALR